MSSCGIWDGVDGSGSFTPSLDTGGRNAVISAGQGVIKGQLWRADASVSTPIPAASAQNRLDRLVLQLNRTASSSPTVVAPVVVTGTPSGSPVLPSLTQNPTGIYQIPISYWTSASSGSLTALVDQRQYAGRTVISMTSTYHPTPANPCLGIEIDTGYVFSWNGTTWSPFGAVTIQIPSDVAISSTTPAPVTGMVFQAAARRYRITGFIRCVAAASGTSQGLAIQFQGTATASAVCMEVNAWNEGQTAPTNPGFISAMAANSAIVMPAVGTNQVFDLSFDGHVTFSAPGTFQVCVYETISSSDLQFTIQGAAGRTWMRYEPQ
jgi:hypothetical protein